MSGANPPPIAKPFPFGLVAGVLAVLIILGFIAKLVFGKKNDPPASGCTANSECKDSSNPVCRDGVCGPSCRNTADCTGTDVCQNGKCVPPATSGCTADSECKDPANPVCRSGACGPRCRDTGDCTSPNVCQNGNCVPVGTPPCSISNCPAPNQCIDGICTPSSCLNDNGCTPPNICKNGVCVSPECTANTGCSGTGQMCEGNRCLNIKACTNDTPCDPGRFCRNGTCMRACVDDAACPRGTTCRGGVCLQTCTGAGCPFNHTCTDGVCVKTVCSVSNPCPGNFNCNSGVCEPVCSRSSDCPGRDCRFGYCYTQNCKRFEVYDNGCRPTFTTLQEVPTAGFNRDPFRMFEGVVDDKNTCLDLCEKSRDCQLAFTGKAPTGQNTCTLWSRGVNLSTVPTFDPDSQTHNRNYS